MLLLSYRSMANSKQLESLYSAALGYDASASDADAMLDLSVIVHVTSKHEGTKGVACGICDYFGQIDCSHSTQSLQTPNMFHLFDPMIQCTHMAGQRSCAVLLCAAAR